MRLYRLWSLHGRRFQSVVVPKASLFFSFASSNPCALVHLTWSTGYRDFVIWLPYTWIVLWKTGMPRTRLVIWFWASMILLRGLLACKCKLRFAEQPHNLQNITALSALLLQFLLWEVIFPVVLLSVLFGAIGAWFVIHQWGAGCWKASVSMVVGLSENFRPCAELLSAIFISCVACVACSLTSTFQQ